MKYIVLGFIFFSYFHLTYAEKSIATLIMPHPPLVNAARELAGWENIINVSSSKKNYTVFAINPEVTLSFRPERIAQCFFGDSIIECKNTLTIKGSQASNRSNKDWLADYFGLPTDFHSVITFEPRVSNALIDFDFFIGFDAYIPGFYFRIHSPLVYTRWDLGLNESLVTTGSNAYDPGYFNAPGIAREQLVNNFTTFITGTEAPKTSAFSFNKLHYAKMSCRAQRLVQLADIQLALGLNIFQQPNYHLGGNIRCTIPTSSIPQGEYLFEPIVGNGHHWEVGGGISAHIVLWENKETEEHAGIYFDANITHLFPTCQRRSFDLCHNDINSRYMIAQRMTPNVTQNLHGLFEGILIEPKGQYQEEISTVANLTTLLVNVSVAVQADLAIMLSYTKEKNSWGFGYSFWAKSSEKITLDFVTPFDTMQWALKGDSMVFGFEENVFSTPIALSATQSKATIYHGLNFAKTGAVTSEQITTGKKNSNIDNPVPAWSDSNNDMLFEPVLTTAQGSDPINTSLEPIFLGRKDIDILSACTRSISHKIFSHFTHIVPHELSPYLSIGAEIEFGKDAVCNKEITLCKQRCINTALSYWGVWIKSGILF